MAGKAWTDEQKKRLSLSRIGRKFSEKAKQALRDAYNSGRFKKGMVSTNKGKKMSEETKLKISLSKKGKNTGELNHNWIKDRSLIKLQKERNNPEYKQWRSKVWGRDKYKCRIANAECSGRLEAHHILGWKSHPELRYQINNGITLCHAHHPRKRSEEAKLSPYFQKLVAEMK